MMNYKSVEKLIQSDSYLIHRYNEFQGKLINYNPVLSAPKIDECDALSQIENLIHQLNQRKEIHKKLKDIIQICSALFYDRGDLNTNYLLLKQYMSSAQQFNKHHTQIEKYIFCYQNILSRIDSIPQLTEEHDFEIQHNYCIKQFRDIQQKAKYLKFFIYLIAKIKEKILLLESDNAKTNNLLQSLIERWILIKNKNLIYQAKEDETTTSTGTNDPIKSIIPSLNASLINDIALKLQEISIINNGLANLDKYNIVQTKLDEKLKMVKNEIISYDKDCFTRKSHVSNI